LLTTSSSLLDGIGKGGERDLDLCLAPVHFPPLAVLLALHNITLSNTNRLLTQNKDEIPQKY
jgi:hypothetical protein